MRKSKNLNNRGITLIALVITIIVLLILAAISIAALTGENGILTKSKIAQIRTEYTSAEEIIKLRRIAIQAESEVKGEKCTIQDIEEGMYKADNITIEKYYNKEEASIKEGVDRNNGVTLEAIVVSANEYAKYKFLIGETSQIEGVLVGTITDATDKEEFKTKEEFEKEIFGTEKKEEVKVDPSLLTNPEEFGKAIQEPEKLEYIIKNPDIFMEKITQDTQLSTKLFENEKAIDLIISNDIWRDKILASDGDITGENSNIIKALDDSGVINLPTTDLELYDPETKTGNTLYSSYLRNEAKHSPVNAFIGGRPGYTDWETESDGLPAYIGYDFGEENKVWIYKVYVKPGNNYAPTKMYLQSSNDNIEWETIYEFTQYTKPSNEVTEVINSSTNRKKSRYWRLYITESTSQGKVDFLKIQFYGK